MAHRRTFLQRIAALPLIGGFAGKGSAVPVVSKPRDVIRELGVRTFINAAGTYTALTSSLMPAEVMEAMTAASKHFVSLHEMQDKVGERIATLLGAEAAMVTSGAAGALTIGTAACLTGTNAKAIQQLPDLTGLKSEVLIQKSHRYGYDHAVRATGNRRSRLRFGRCHDLHDHGPADDRVGGRAGIEHPWTESDDGRFRTDRLRFADADHLRPDHGDRLAVKMLSLLFSTLFATIVDVIPIIVVILAFQLFVLRRPISNLPRVVWGFACVLLGLTLFLVGLELALFPLGEEMAAQLTSAEFLGREAPGHDSAEVAPVHWYDHRWTYLFGFMIGLSTTIAEPALIAVALKAEEVSGGAIRAWGLRSAVALGVGLGVALGTFRIVIGVPLPYFILLGYGLVIIQTHFAPKEIVPLAYDSGGVTTSTVTVPLVTALGLGLSAGIPGRDPLIDGFGLIAFASLFPMMTVMGYAQIARYLARRHQRSVQVAPPN